MKQNDLPEKWQNRIKTHLKKTGSKYKEFSVNDFQHDLKITFADNSYAFFNYAFYLIDDEAKEIAVFTEHCGFHIFPLIDTKLEIIDKNENIIKIEDFKIE